MHQLEHVNQFTSDLFSKVTSQSLVFILYIAYHLDNREMDRKAESVIFFNYCGSLQALQQTGLATAQHPSTIADYSSVTHETMLLINSNQQPHPASETIRRQGPSCYDSHIIVS